MKERPELAREIENKVRVSLGVRELEVLKGANPAAKKAGGKEAKEAKDAPKEIKDVQELLRDGMR